MDQNAKCYRLTLVLILELLQDQGIYVKEQDVVAAEVTGDHISLNKANTSQIYLKAVLGLKTLLPENLEGKISNKTFQNSPSAVQNTLLPSTHFSTVELARLLITSENLPKQQKSKIEILFQIKGIEADSFRKDNLRTKERHSNKGILDQVFNRDEWISEHLKLQKFHKSSIYLGFCLALIASTLSGMSFVLKKRSLLKLDKRKVYYTDKRWWMAHSLMIVGDMLHFAAFFFSPAVLICTIQMLVVLVVAVASSYILSETVNEYWRLAFATSLGGCFVIIVHVPKEPHITSIDTFLYMVTDPIFMAYLLALLSITIVMVCYGIPRWGHINSIPYTFQSAIFGSVVVITLKGVLLVFTDKLFHWLPWVCILIVGICLLLQLEYLTRALTYYNTLVVAIQYYVLYFTFVMLGSSLLFDVWKKSSGETMLLVFLGFSTVALGVWIFAIFQDPPKFDFKNLRDESDKEH